MIVSFHTLGCKVNQYETEVLSGLFAAEGYKVEDSDAPDVIIINSCTVTSSGDKKTRQLLRRLRRSHPQAVIALTGCFPQAFPEQASTLTEADIITGSKNRGELPKLIRRAAAGEGPIISIIPHNEGESFENMSSGGMDRTRAFVKIEDGCNHHCTYCIIPTARGPVRSKPLGELAAELQTLARSGHREVVLAGINLASYGLDTSDTLTDAVRLACSVDGIMRVRLGSMEPDLLSHSDINELSLLPRLCPQFHLSLQSGCDRTLRRMGRKYNTDYYRKLVAEIRLCFDNPSITTDIMVGFPGETEEDFEQSMEFVREIGFSSVHVFPYSPRPGTPAEKLPEQIPAEVKTDRARRMQSAADEVQQRFLQNMVGREESILVEKNTNPAQQYGYTANYTRVKISHTEVLTRRFVKVLITQADSEGCSGYILE